MRPQGWDVIWCETCGPRVNARNKPGFRMWLFSKSDQMLSAQHMTRGFSWNNQTKAAFNRGHRWDRVGVTFGWGRQPAASRCSCSEVWLETRSEQHTAQPSLFIREEMMLQPQPHIDLLISGPRRIRRGRDGEGKKRNPKQTGLQAGATSWSLLWFPESSQLVSLL